jgi:integrase
MNKLTQKSLPRLEKIRGRHRDGSSGLYLMVRDPVRSLRYWTYRYRFNGKQTELSLGAYPETTLAEARARYAEKSALVLKGEDPIADKHTRRREAPVRGSNPTFAAVAEQYIEAHENKWSNPKHARQWRSSVLAGPCANILGPMPISKIGVNNVLQVLEPMWSKTRESASRLRGRIEQIIAAGYVRADIDKGNPARWRNHLDKLLPAPSDPTNFAAMPYKDVPVFIIRLRGPTVTARALEFCILTSARSSEARCMTWDEVSFDDELWTVSANRMKTRKLHRIPLSDRALEILRLQYETHGDNPHVFPGTRPMRPLNDTAFQLMLRAVGATGITVHGFRSSFRDWAGDETHFPREVIEQALAHVVGGVEGDYRRGDALKKRRELMDAWAAYCDGPT